MVVKHGLIKGRTQAKGIAKHDNKVNIWAQERGEFANWELRRLHNEELHSLYRSPITVRAI